MTIAQISELVSIHLPNRYEPLLLTFYHNACRATDEYVIIGDDYGTDLCARLSDGAVLSIDPQKEFPTRFVNSGIQQLAQFIEISKSFGDSKITDSAALAQQMQETLAKIDPKAFCDPDNWWAVVLEQLAYGL